MANVSNLIGLFEFLSTEDIFTQSIANINKISNEI